MSKTKRSGDRARIAALEKDLRRLRAGIRSDIVHAVRHELAVALDATDPPAGLYPLTKVVWGGPPRPDPMMDNYRPTAEQRRLREAQA